ncbi:endonuclease/exonuclease/phosphatase family protein [Afifella pfennigii]|uniref:endonuclease/exonuclease/phosphatase family protein n=1 Tax=Afifella pfennigii TaxID=209897 RepID=UPI00047E3628|nr:endonuclease/exonuclease/phosphatase family protein [Afifella pfennigii]
MKLVLRFGLFAALFLSALSFAGALSPNLDAINHFRPFIFAAFLALAAFAAFLRARAAMLAALFLAAAQFYFLATELAPKIGVERALASNARLKLVTLNMLDTRTDPQALVSFVERERPDVLVLVEAWPNVVATLDRVEELMPYRFDCFEARSCDISVLSRLPFRSAKVWRPGPDDPPEPRFPALARLQIVKDGMPVTLWATHLHWPFPADEQEAEFANLKTRLADAEPNTILAGDFNSTPWSYALRRFDAATPLTRVTRALPTWPSTNATFRGRFTLPAFGPVMPLDHVYLGTGLAAADIRRGPNLGSDHYPVIVEIAPSS